uniref:J domain-containing protein n=1 Tax=Arcella intermedia TaxID=1963864 RepID=A0A6B2LDG1_9EUKA
MFGVVVLACLSWGRCSHSNQYYDMINDILAKGPTYYEELELARDAGDGEVSKAYRAASRKYHPDKNKEAGAQEKYLRIQKAYEVLSNEALRQEYDELLDNGIPWEERYYGQYMHRYGVPQHDIKHVLVGLIILITIAKHAYQHYRHHVLTDMAKRSDRYKQKKNQLKAASSEIGEAPEEPQIKIHGAEPPTWRDLFIIQLLLSPYTIVVWLMSCTKQKTEEERKEEFCVKMGITREELERRLKRQQEKMENMKESSKYKKFIRLKKKGVI